MNYLLVTAVVEKGAARLRPVQNVPDAFRLTEGLSCLEDFPEDAEFRMSEDFPKDVRLSDYMKNNSSLLLVSERFKACLEAFPGALAGNEVLPARIMNHKKRAEKAPYFIIHQTPPVPCLDMKKSKGEEWDDDPGEFQIIEKMVLNEKQVPKDRLLFRPEEYKRLPIIRRDLAEALQKAKLTGVEFAEIDGYDF